MARVKRYLDSRASDNHERWLVSYADFITLLFAFFVVMYALSSVNEGKYRLLSNSLGSAFGITGPGQLVARPQGLQGQISKSGGEALLARHRERLSELSRGLGAALAPLATEGEIRVLQTARGG